MSNSRLTVLACGAFAFVLLATGPSESRAADPHPAQALIERAAVGARTDPSAGSRDARAALELLAKEPNPDLQIQAHLLLCDHLSERDQVAAREQARLAREFLPSATRAGLRAGLLVCEGTILEFGGDNVAARARYDEAVRIATEADDQEYLAEALFARGYLLGVLGHYAPGLADLKRAQGLYRELGLEHHAITTMNSIATLYNRMGDYAQAREMYERALRAQREAGLRREVIVTLHNLGRAHENLGEWDAARAAFQESYKMTRELAYVRGEAYALRGLAAVANATGDPRGALARLERAAELQKQTPDARLNAQIQLARGVALHRLKQLPASLAALHEARKVFEAAQSLNELRATYAELAAVEAEMGDWRQAYVWQAKSHEATERLLRNQLDQRFATLRIEFDTAAKEHENALLLRENLANQKALEQERRARSLQAIVILLTILLAGLLAAVAAHQWRITRRMRRLAMTDELTGVPNRRAVLSQLDPLIEAGTPCALLIVDIDHFKSINDQHGHPEGDEALRLVAGRLSTLVQPPALLGRLGGEEFVVVFPEIDQEQALAHANRIREEVTTIDTSRWLAAGQITVSIGLTMSKRGDTASTILQRADVALYEAKRAGRNCVRSHVPLSSEPPKQETADATPDATAEFA